MSEEALDLEQTIEDAVNDAVTPAPEIDEIGDEVESQPEQSTETPLETSEEPPQETAEVPSPATQQQSQEPQDPFEKLVGVPQNGITGRENRIPYSRVKKITEKAVGEVAEAALGRKLAPGEKAADVVKNYVAQIPQLQEQVKGYEDRLTTVGQFENVMANDPQQFLQMLSRLPAYSRFFTFVENAYNALQAGNYQPQGQAISAGTGAPQTGSQPQEDPMPEPDQTLTDGSKVYSMEGLKTLMAWQSRQVESKVSRQFDDKYKALESQYQPIRKDWEDYQRRQSVLPVIRQQIADARTWPLFNENENDITKALENDRNLSLEAAYRKIVFPKLIAERNTVRQNVLEELKHAPAATAVATRQTKPNPPAEGPRSLEDIIKQSIEELK